MSFFQRKTAEVIGITPSDQFVPPKMALDKYTPRSVRVPIILTPGDEMQVSLSPEGIEQLLNSLKRIADAAERENELYEAWSKADIEAIQSASDAAPGFCGQTQPHLAHMWAERYSTTAALHQNCSGHS